LRDDLSHAEAQRRRENKELKILIHQNSSSDSAMPKNEPQRHRGRRVMRVPEVFCRSPVGVLANGRIMVWAYPELRLDMLHTTVK